MCWYNYLFHSSSVVYTASVLNVSLCYVLHKYLNIIQTVVPTQCAYNLYLSYRIKTLCDPKFKICCNGEKLKKHLNNQRDLTYRQ